VSVGVSHVKISPWKDFVYKERKKEIKKKLSDNFGCMGRSNPWGDLDQMWHVGRYGRRNHEHNFFGDCRLRGVSLVRGVILPSPSELRYCPYNTGHTTYKSGLCDGRPCNASCQSLFC